MPNPQRIEYERALKKEFLHAEIGLTPYLLGRT
jgi:hypothetical protein